jgi:hypothetical protein
VAFESGHALLIGVGTYHHVPEMDVPEAARDAAAVAGVLADPRSCGYPPAQVTLLRDAQATREGVLAALDALAGRTTPEDTAVVFYCGHGAFGDDGHYSLTTHDTRVAAGRVAGGTGVSQQELLARVKALPVRRALLLFNACHAGALSPTLGPSEPLEAASLPADATEALLGTGEGRVIVTACREEQVSYIGEGPLSLFTGALVDALGGKGVPNRTGYISAFDLYTASTTRSARPCGTRYGEQQEPELTVQKGVGPMAVALYRGATATGTFEAPVDRGPPRRPHGRIGAGRAPVPGAHDRRPAVGDRTEVHTGGGAQSAGGSRPAGAPSSGATSSFTATRYVATRSGARPDPRRRHLRRAGHRHRAWGAGERPRGGHRSGPRGAVRPNLS